METPKAFISFDYEKNSNENLQFLELLKKSNISLVIDSCSRKPTLPENQWQNVVSDKINYCNMLIVLAGKTTASVKGVLQEIEAARLQNIPVFGIYVGGADNTTALPIGLKRERTVNLEGYEIADEIKQAMKEGKNELLLDKTSGIQGESQGIGNG
jgi:hypothetical protein